MSANSPTRSDQQSAATPSEQSADGSAEPTSQKNDSPTVPIADLLKQESVLRFAGLTEHDSQDYPNELESNMWCRSSTPRTFKDVVKALPAASSGELWATNEFIGTSGDVDIDAIRSVEGLDIEGLERGTGSALETIAQRSAAEPVVEVQDHQDIVDERRKALHALGYDVKFRWQIASDSYTIINPQEAYLPIISALQQRGEDDVFGWASYRDWGGLLKMVVICPSLRRVVSAGEEDLEELDGDGLTAATPEDEAPETVVYGGFQTGYDFRGTQTLWARPILFFPASGTVLPDTGKRYTRRHYGKATDAAHERANNRTPINEWWRSIYDDIDTRMVTVETAIQRSRAIAYDFEELPFSLKECYTYWGIAKKYAERAANRAKTIARPTTRPTVFNIQLSLLIALLEEYNGSMASNSYQEYIEVAGELYRTPSMMIQLAMQEHDKQTTDSTDRVLPEDQQTLSDSLEDLFDVPGITVETELDLSNEQAQRVQDGVQQRLDESV
ncbi:hypothetical protein [Haloarcula rubra]|uniref:hypothetical protein n=1 Tax=Haloarcula rubra TaxID=2487747 RepID=UPI001F22F942|nr:hypothetical protein [Halomicroarcula rubra]